jgi:hypothetical protein
MGRSWLRPLAVAVWIALASGALTAEGRFRTPAEIELRRAEIAVRLRVLAEEQLVLEAERDRLQDAMASPAFTNRATLTRAVDEIALRLEGLSTERDVLTDEARELEAVRTRTATGPIARADPQGLSPAQIAGDTGQVSAGTAFNPSITVIPDGVYYYDDSDGQAAERFGGIEGFGTPGADVEAGQPPRGFSLREVELAFSGAVDPYFDVWATFGIGDGAIETEEVYVQTRRFLPGTQVRFGRFFSGAGYLNRQHRHQWDFVDQALPYQALLGARLDDVGVQITWLPPIPVYAQFGFEALQGDHALVSNQLTESFPGQLGETPGPRLFTGFVKVSPDLGFSNTLQIGASAGRSRSHQEARTDGLAPELFDGTSWFLGTDWIWRYDSAQQYGRGDLTVQGEYIARSKTLEPVNVPGTPGSSSQQDGFYAQIVYGVGPRWTVGGRFDAIGLRNRVETPGARTDFGAATRYTADVTLNPTEFSRLRVQYNYGRLPDATGRLHQLYVQLQMSLGVHGAHSF